MNRYRRDAVKVAQLATLMLLVYACRREGPAASQGGRLPPLEIGPIEPSRPLSRDAGVVPEPIAMSLWATVSIDLARLASGQVVGYNGDGRSQLSIYLFEREGQTRTLDRVSAAVPALLLEGFPVRALGGTLPGVLVLDTFRNDGVNRGLVIRVDDARAVIERQVYGCMFAPFPWKDGTLLALLGIGRVDGQGERRDHVGRFEIVGPSKLVPPQLPTDALVDEGFIAYPTGRIFVLGGRKTRLRDGAADWEKHRGFTVEGALVWQSDAGGTKIEAVQLPETMPHDELRGRLFKGTVETETVIFGSLDDSEKVEPYFAHFGPRGWHRIPNEKIRGIGTIDVANDGSIWATRLRSTEPTTIASLERVILGVDGSVTFQGGGDIVPGPAWASALADAGESLPRCRSLVPGDFRVIDAKNIWMNASCVADGGAKKDVFLHTGPQGRL